MTDDTPELENSAPVGPEPENKKQKVMIPADDPRLIRDLQMTNRFGIIWLLLLLLCSIVVTIIVPFDTVLIAKRANGREMAIPLLVIFVFPVFILAVSAVTMRKPPKLRPISARAFRFRYVTYSLACLFFTGYQFMCYYLFLVAAGKWPW